MTQLSGVLCIDSIWRCRVCLCHIHYGSLCGLFVFFFVFLFVFSMFSVFFRVSLWPFSDSLVFPWSILDLFSVSSRFPLIFSLLVFSHLASFLVFSSYWSSSYWSSSYSSFSGILCTHCASGKQCLYVSMLVTCSRRKQRRCFEQLAAYRKCLA